MHRYLTQPEAGSPEDVAAVPALFERIDEEPYVPFVAFRKCNGLAYGRWKLGDTDASIHFAERAEMHAGDGGFVRFRIPYASGPWPHRNGD